jgi:endonuclease III
MNNSDRLAEYIRVHPTLKIVTTLDGNYGHMGATLTDAALQAGVRYATVVRPRVQRLLAEYPQATTSSTFLKLLTELGSATLLQWSGGRKIDTLLELTRLLVAESVETEDDFRTWIAVPRNLDRLQKIKGIKDKTANYLEILLGKQSVAVDRHLFRFLAEAGLPITNYDEAHVLIRNAAILLDINISLLDHSIWRYMSERSKP